MKEIINSKVGDKLKLFKKINGDIKEFNLKIDYKRNFNHFIRIQASNEELPTMNFRLTKGSKRKVIPIYDVLNDFTGFLAPSDTMDYNHCLAEYSFYTNKHITSQLPLP